MSKETLVEASNGQPRISVGLPLYRAGPIAWVAMESLVRQKDPPSWELVVAEEKEPFVFGEEKLLSFWDRLKKANCTGIYYISLNKWMPLSLKWREIVHFCCPESVGFVLQAADNFSLPIRLNKTYLAFQRGFNHVQWRPQLIYYITDGNAVYYSHEDYNKTAGAMAYEMDLISRLPAKKKISGVDSWILRCVKSFVGKRYSKKEYNGCGEISIKGLNNISGEASKRCILKGALRERSCCSREELLEYLPKELLDRIDELKPLADKWRVKPWKK